MRCSRCNEKLAVHDLWCIKCGKNTEVLKNELSATKSLNKTWQNYKPLKGVNMPVGIWATMTGALPLFLILWITNFALTALPVWQLVLIRNLVWIFFLPILLVPFHAVCYKDGYTLNVSDFFSSFKFYPQYLILSLISIVYYLAIHYICIGDPILRLVWLVLVIYWITIVLPVPVLMERYGLNAWKAIKLSYKSAGDVRWNIFLMSLILLVANLLATLMFIVCLAVILPYSWFAIRDYVDTMIEYEVFDTKVKA